MLIPSPFEVESAWCGMCRYLKNCGTVGYNTERGMTFPLVWHGLYILRVGALDEIGATVCVVQVVEHAASYLPISIIQNGSIPLRVVYILALLMG